MILFNKRKKVKREKLYISIDTIRKVNRGKQIKRYCKSSEFHG